VIHVVIVCVGSVLAAHAAGEPLTKERVGALPADERRAWAAYLERSATLAAGDRAVLQNELAVAGIEQAIMPPTDRPRSVPADANDAWYASEEASSLATNVLSFQTPSGGWSKHVDFSAGPREPGMQWTAQHRPGGRFHYVATFDNGATTGEVMFLARVATAADRPDCRAGVVRGLRFILDAQYPNGGWPQVFPLEGGYHDAITFNDDAMIHVLELLEGAAAGAPPFAFLPPTLRREAESAVDRGVACILAAQLTLRGRRAGWCSQHDPLTLAPTAARAYEPASLSGLESSHIVRWLMRRPTPNAELVAAVEAALAWLDGSRITNLKKVAGPNRTVYVEDEASAEIYWARFYDLATGRPIFPGRNGIVYDSFAALAEAQPRLGYDYLSTRPLSIVTTQATKWRQRLDRDGKDARASTGHSLKE